METVQYISTSKIKTILQESLKDNRVTIRNTIKEVFLESISSKYVLTEGVKENLEKLVDNVMFFFKNVKANNERVDVLLNIAHKVYSNGLDFSNIPALNNTLSKMSKMSLSGDRLTIFMKLWMNYILIQYKGTSPLLVFTKELNDLERFLENLRKNNTLQGINNNIDSILSEHGLIYVLKKLSNELTDEAEKIHLSQPNEIGNKKPNLKDLVQHDMFVPNKLPDNSKDYTIQLDDYRERLSPPANSRSLPALHEAVFRSFLTLLG